MSDAFRNFREEKELSEEEKGAIEAFTDMFVSCSLNPETIHEDKEVGQKIVNIIKAVNHHNCTNPCEKYGEKCKYGFPRYPLKRTLVIDKNEKFQKQQQQLDEGKEKKYMKILSDHPW